MTTPATIFVRGTVVTARGGAWTGTVLEQTRRGNVLCQASDIEPDDLLSHLGWFPASDLRSVGGGEWLDRRDEVPAMPWCSRFKRALEQPRMVWRFPPARPRAPSRGAVDRPATAGPRPRTWA
jgi:hypothetical protein